MALERRHGDRTRADGGSAANELIMIGGHVGTHVDALAHVSQDGLVYGGTPAESLQSNVGFAQLGIDTFQPYVGRAVLLDVTAVHGVNTLPAGYEVTVEDLEQAKKRAGVEPHPGDAILVGTGWSRCWNDVEAFNGQHAGAPGPGKDAGEWLASWRPRAVGAETIAFEHIAPEQGHALLPVHRIMLVEHGINIVETMNLAAVLDHDTPDFLLVLNPLNIKGATAGPVRPLAVIAR
jgi:kynurenine formamidase